MKLNNTLLLNFILFFICSCGNNEDKHSVDLINNSKNILEKQVNKSNFNILEWGRKIDTLNLLMKINLENCNDKINIYLQDSNLDKSRVNQLIFYKSIIFYKLHKFDSCIKKLSAISDSNSPEVFIMKALALNKKNKIRISLNFRS